MRLLLLFAERDGGLPEHIRVLARELATRGHEVAVAGPPDTIVRDDLEQAGVAFEEIPIVASMLSPVRDGRVVVKLFLRLLSRRVDLVHAHGQKGGILGRMAAKLARVPAVYSPHGIGYRSQPLRARRSGAMRHALTLALERRLGRSTAAIVACSEDERRAALGDGLADRNRVHLIYNGVKLDTSAVSDPALTAFRGAGPLVGTVTSLREEKDLPTLVAAIAVLGARSPSARCAIVGNGPRRMQIQRRIGELNLEDVVVLAPFSPPVERYLRTLDVFVLPSRWEGLPISVLEAMAAGLPVVATRVNGVPEAVQHEVTGLLVEPADALALADAIGSLLADPPKRARMGAAGREVAHTRFTVKRMTDEIQNVYASAVCAPR
jgi:glycosyltransferase involved in cell wall biosynthesis